MNLFNELTPPPNQIIRARWWNQPYASLMLPPYLKDETRTRPTNVRGPVLICACKAPYDWSTVIGISGDDQYKRIAEIPEKIYEDPDGDEWELPLGQAIGIGNLVSCFPMKPEHEDKCFVKYKEPWVIEREIWRPAKSSYEVGRMVTIKEERRLWIWHFEDVRPIEPFEIKGKQGWAILDEATKAKIKVL